MLCTFPPLHVDVIARQHAADDGHAEFLADLPDDVADTLAQGAVQNLVANGSSRKRRPILRRRLCEKTALKRSVCKTEV